MTFESRCAKRLSDIHLICRQFDLVRPVPLVVRVRGQSGLLNASPKASRQIVWLAELLLSGGVRMASIDWHETCFDGCLAHRLQLSKTRPKYDCKKRLDAPLA